MIATGLLHLSGIALGLVALAGRPAGVRIGGGAIACVGLYFLAGALAGT